MSVTYFAAMPFNRDEEGNAVPGEAKDFQDAGKAVRWASIMASAEGACGAVAYSRTGDPALGDWADAVILKQIGEIGDLPSS